MQRQQFYSLFLLTGLLYTASLPLQGQVLSPHLYSTCGDQVIAGSVMLSYSIGEPLVLTQTNSGMVLTQGFQQVLPFGPVSIQIPDHAGTVTIFPNPFNDILNLSWSSFWFEGDLVNINIRTISGQTVLDRVVAPSPGLRTTFDNLGMLPSGSYFICLSNPSSGKQVTFPIIKIHQP